MTIRKSANGYARWRTEYGEMCDVEARHKVAARRRGVDSRDVNSACVRDKDDPPVSACQTSNYEAGDRGIKN